MGRGSFFFACNTGSYSLGASVQAATMPKSHIKPLTKAVSTNRGSTARASNRAATPVVIDLRQYSW